MEKKPQHEGMYKIVVSDRVRQMMAEHIRFLAQIRDCLEISWSFPRKIGKSGQACGESIEQVISKQSLNTSAARKTKNSLIDAIRSLHQMPERFPFLQAEFIPPNKYHKIFVEKWHLILYQIKDQTVFVEAIVDCRQDYQWLVR